jgi:hypothetical protein
MHMYVCACMCAGMSAGALFEVIVYVLFLGICIWEQH